MFLGVETKERRTKLDLFPVDVQKVAHWAGDQKEEWDWIHSSPHLTLGTNGIIQQYA